MWALPNPLVEALYPILKGYGFGLQDIEWARDPKSYQELQVTFRVLKLNAVINVGVDAVSFAAFNPDWNDAPNLAELFQTVRDRILQLAKVSAAAQEIALAMHVQQGDTPFPKIMRNLVNADTLGEAETYGVSTYSSDYSMVIDKSARYDNSVFVRLHRRFSGSATVKDIAAAVYADENRALGLLGLEELLENRQ